MNLKEMGENFRCERERQGLTIDDVVQRTKISKSNVTALEDGETSGLPHPVYAKGFARNYAKLLKLDPEECAAVMGREFVIRDNIVKEVPEVEFEAQGSVEIGGNGFKLFVLALALLAMIAGGAIYMFSSSAPEAGLDSHSPAAVEQPVASQAASPAPETVPAQGESSAPALEQPADEPQAQETPLQGDKPVSTAAPVAPTQAAVAPERAETWNDPTDSRQRVLVEAKEPCWLLAQVDGGEDAKNGITVDVMLQPGQSKQIRFHKTLEVKLGNGGGVKVLFNGEPYSFAAQSGQVKTLLFSAP
ncbi:MAG: DUF4115 domain-containing protein [Proteobacteria bacterium]|nr:DUF4115 domain-containing protein [Pseudomonadota bacterium]